MQYSDYEQNAGGFQPLPYQHLKVAYYALLIVIPLCVLTM